MEINKKDKKLTYVDVKKEVKEKYSKMGKNELKEEYYDFYYKKIALESMNPENTTLGAISIIALLMSLVAVTSNYESDLSQYGPIIKSVLVFSLSFYFLLEHKIKYKSKKIVYYSLVLKTIRNLLKE